MDGSGIVEAQEAFAVYLEDGTPFSVSKGDRFEKTDPIVKGRDRLFGDLTVRSSRRRPAPSTKAVETATAAPGAKRTTTKPKAGDGDA